MGKVWASSDWHGCGKIADKVFEYLQSDDTLYFIGDACDRGPDGLRIMQRLLDDKRVIYLCGNHEEMMTLAIPALEESRTDMFVSQWFQNGGYETWSQMELIKEVDRYNLIYQIKKLPFEQKYINKNGDTIILEHAGYTPGDIPHRSHDPLWDRAHFHDNWNKNNSKTKNTYLIHGHTPIQYLKFDYGCKGSTPLTKEELKIKNQWWLKDAQKDYKPTIFRYCDNHKFDIDMCTIVSKRIALLNLDTFEEVYFDE